MTKISRFIEQCVPTAQRVSGGGIREVPITYPVGGRIPTMPPANASQQQHGDFQRHPPILCDACESALHSSGDGTISFLLLDQLTLPLIGCDSHLGQFTTICGFTTEDSAELLSHRPAGGISCPSCHLAPYNLNHPLIPVQNGAVAVLACPEHQVDTIERFQTGLELQQKLTTSLDTLQ